MPPRKRKNRSNSYSSYPYDGKPGQLATHFSASSAEETAEIPARLDTELYIQAYEADILRGPDAVAHALSLEVPKYNDELRGSALIRWSGAAGEIPQPVLDLDEDVFGLGAGAAKMKLPLEGKRDVDDIWVDRYDARLLLDDLPFVLPQQAAPQNFRPGSPSGWTDIPSDNEDVFFLSSEEVEDFRREKKRRHIENLREERLSARRTEDGDTVEGGRAEEDWGGSDEEPDETQRSIMYRTAAHLLSSPNPAQLEMRILANQSRNRHFAFLCGRWSRAWRAAKAKAKEEKEKEKKQASTGHLGGLAGYESWESESESSQVVQAGILEGPGAEMTEMQDMAKIAELEEPEKLESITMEARQSRARARAKEWIEHRGTLKGKSS